MTKTIFVLLFLLTQIMPLQTSDAQTPASKEIPPCNCVCNCQPTINVPTTNNIQNNPQVLNSLSSENTIVATLATSVHNTVISWMTNVQDMKASLLQSIAEKKEASKAFITRYKKLLVLASIAAAYGAIFYKLKSLGWQIQDKHAWLAWKKELPEEELMAMPFKELASELLLDIQRKYTHTDDLSDFLTPLTCFIIDVEKEMNAIKQLQTMHRTITFLGVTFLFPRQDEIITTAPLALARLSYLKNTLITWVSEYKIHKNVPVMTFYDVDSDIETEFMKKTVL